MKTHELADALEQLARMLRTSPDTQLSKLRLEAAKSEPTKHQLAVNLATLVEMSKIDKRQWIELISEFGLAIKLRPRDASRDILGKLLRYLEEHPDAQRSLRNRVVHSPESIASPELLRALNVIMREG